MFINHFNPFSQNLIYFQKLFPSIESNSYTQPTNSQARAKQQ